MQDIIASRQPICYEPETKTKRNYVNYENLVKRAVRGDSDAFSELLPLIAPDVLYSARYILRSQMDAEDAAQEIMIRVCTSIKGLRDPKKFKAWLNSIVMNETRRFMKDNYMNDTGADIDEYINVIEEKNVDYIPHESAEKNDRNRIIMNVIDKLPKNQRLAILFHYYKGLSITETAGMMGVKQQSVSRSLKLAREKIKDELSNKNIGEVRFAGGFAMMSIGVHIKAAMQADADSFAIKNAGWIARSAQTYAPLYSSAKTAAAGSAAAATAGKLSLAIKPVLTAIAAVSASAAVISGVYFYQNTAPSRAETVLAAQGPDANLVCDIVFEGGSAEGEHVNPIRASAQANDSFGELTPRDWWITAAGSEEVLFSGEGSSVDGVFEQMAESGMDGSYTLYYSMLDSMGGTYRIYRDFAISGNAK